MNHEKHRNSRKIQPCDSGLQQETTLGSAIQQCYPSKYSVELCAKLSNLVRDASAIGPVEVMSHEFDAVIVDQSDAYRIVAIYHDRTKSAGNFHQQLQYFCEEHGIYAAAFEPRPFYSSTYFTMRQLEQHPDGASLIEHILRCSECGLPMELQYGAEVDPERNLPKFVCPSGFKDSVCSSPSSEYEFSWVVDLALKACKTIADSNSQLFDVLSEHAPDRLLYCQSEAIRRH